MRPTVHILILAAGASSRMRGRDKLLEPVKGKPILRQVTTAACATGAPVLVALSLGDDARRKVLEGTTAVIIEVPDAKLGMSRSIVSGIKAISSGGYGTEDGLMILPADMPGFSTKILAEMISRFRAEPSLILRGGTIDGRPGHPAIFPQSLWAELAEVTGDEGGRSVLKRHHDLVSQVPLPGDTAVLDLDTPEDWAAFRGRPQGSA